MSALPIEEILLSAKDICFNAGGRKILDNVSLNLKRNEIVTVIGPNGAGKSSLVKVLLGLKAASSGSISTQPGLRLGYVPQRLHLNPLLPLNVMRFLRQSGRSKSACLKALTEVGLDRAVAQSVHHLSGGEWQRILLARALLRKPQLLVLDEPVQGVDLHGQTELYELIASLRQRYQCGVLMVSHDLHLVMAQSDRVICLNQHVCCHGHPSTVSTDPAYLALFGRRHAEAVALYHHHHDHEHDVHGKVVDHD